MEGSAMATKIAIYGAGGFAREVAWLIEACNEPVIRYKLVSFIDDNVANHGRVLNDVPIMGLTDMVEHFPDAQVVSGIGSPQLREKTMERVAAAGLVFATVIHPRVERSRWVDIGEGTVICAGNILTTNIRLGQHVQINLDCTIGHDVVMGDFTTLAPGAHVSGCVHFGLRVYVGTGAVIINGLPHAPLIIGDDAVIGAAACVTKSVPPGVTVVGVPARPLQKE
jgi:sugar O-acyltransferase (sialic acid O-acetyltransferase NeuD family)